MSVVTNVVAAYGLCGHEGDYDLLAEINECCEVGDLKHCENSDLPNRWYGGSKFLEVNIAVGAFNHLQLREWIDRIRERVDFEKYRCDFLQFMVQTQDALGFGIVNVWTNDVFDPFCESDLAT